MTQNNFVATDYIHFTKKDGKVAVSSIDTFHGGLNWFDQNKACLKRGRIMQDSSEAMAMYLAVVNAHLKKSKLYHPEKNNPLKRGEVVEESTVEKLYNEFTRSNWQNLNNYFEKNSNGKMTMKKAIGLDDDGELIYSKPEMVKYLNRDGILVNLKDFNKEGLVTKKSKNKRLDREKNIYFYAPKNFSVARLGSGIGSPIWYGNRNPENYDSDLRVRESLPIGQ